MTTRAEIMKVAMIVVGDVATTTCMHGLALISMAARNWWDTGTMTIPLPTPKSPARGPRQHRQQASPPAQNTQKLESLAISLVSFSYS